MKTAARELSSCLHATPAQHRGDGNRSSFLREGGWVGEHELPKATQVAAGRLAGWRAGWLAGRRAGKANLPNSMGS